MINALSLLLVIGHFLQPVASVLADNCSSLLDCWDTLGAAAAAAIGAGAAAVFAGGMLLSPGGATDGTVEVDEGEPVPGGAVAGAQPTQPFSTPVGAPSSHPQGIPGPGQGSGSGGVPGHAAPGTQPSIQSSVQPSVQPSVQAGTAAPDTNLAAGLALGVTPVAGALGSAIARAGGQVGSDMTRSSSSSDSEGDEDEPELDACPEADASLFGLPDINTRKDCPGTRPSMGPQYAGIDFSSNDDHGHEMPLVFEAGITGEVTFVGGPFNMVEVVLESGSKVQFLHASQINVRVGQKVRPTTKLGKTGGAGPLSPNQYEIHLHVQALDKKGRAIDPDCLLAGKDNRRLRVKAPDQEQARTEQLSALTGVLSAAAAAGGAPAPATVVCGVCGRNTPAGSSFCAWCGNPFVPGGRVGAGTAPLVQSPAPAPIQAPPQIPPQMPPQAPPVQAPQRQFCGRCGTPNHIEARFCVMCAMPLVPLSMPAPHHTATQTVYCGNCGQPHTPDAVFCGRCGRPLIKPR